MDKNKLRKIFSVFLTFLRIGAFTFGGGYAMIPLIRREAVEKNGWINDDDMLEMLAIAESTPGPIAINSATFVGHRVAGFFGSAAATFGVVLPSFVIISVIATVLQHFSDITAVKYAFAGIRAGVLALVVKAWWSMFKKCPKNLAAYIIAGSAFIAVAVFKLNVLLVLVICAAAGLVTAEVMERRARK